MRGLINLVNVDNHVGYVFSLFCSQRSGDFVSGSEVNSGENVPILTPIQRITGHIQQVELMHLIGNSYFIVRFVDVLWKW